MKNSSLILLFCAMVIFCSLTACATGTASFVGFVTDRNTEDPLKGAEVRNRCENEDGDDYNGILCFGPVKAGDSGLYRLKMVPGSYDIIATKSGYETEEKFNKVPNTGGKILHFKLIK